MGYGKRALEQLCDFYEGRFSSLNENDSPEGIRSTLADADEQGLQRMSDAELTRADLHRDSVGVRDAANLPALFLRLSEKRAARLHWLGVSYGLTSRLHKFWRSSGYAPVYLRQTSNELTGEYSCVMLRELRTEGLAVAANAHWLDAFARDFHRRFGTLLSFAFSDFTALLALSILDAANSGRSDESRALDAVPYTRADLTRDFSPYDLKRLDSYANNLVDYHVVLDLLPTIAQNFFAARFGAGVSLTGVQQCILLGIGLQHKSVDAVDKEFNLPSRQILAMFTKIMRKVSNYFRNLETSAIAAEIDAKASSAQSTAKRSLTDESAWDPTAMSLEDDLADGGQQ
ncbi:N-acetyltransferase 10, partial [Coemansia sp. RSA 475]